MDANKAIKTLKHHYEWLRNSWKPYPDQKVLDVIGNAISALEKQIPKKPTYVGDGYAPDGTFVWDEWICPNCGSRYELEYDEYNFCPNCGQAIDWSENVAEKTEEE